MSPRFQRVLSTIDEVPLSYFVYSAFSYYGSRRGGELSGAWLVRALGVAGREPAAVRQTLYRMEQHGELIGRKVSRTKYYRPSPFAQAEIEAGTAKLLHPSIVSWDGEWTVVHIHEIAADEFSLRRIQSVMQVEGFGAR